jgi:hypothetical protein
MLTLSSPAGAKLGPFPGRFKPFSPSPLAAVSPESIPWRQGTQKKARKRDLFPFRYLYFSDMPWKIFGVTLPFF